MAVKKEWFCKGCQYEFESAIDLCKRCGQVATRAFRTPVGVNTGGVARKVDRLLERNFEKRGIANYSNRDGAPKISWREHPRIYAESDWRAGGWGKEHLGRVNELFGSNFSPPGLSGPRTRELEGPLAQEQASRGWGSLVPRETINDVRAD